MKLNDLKHETKKNKSLLKYNIVKFGRRSDERKLLKVVTDKKTS